MDNSRQIFTERQPKVSVCASGRAMVALNEAEVNTPEQIAVGMTDDGEMLMEERTSKQYSYDVYWLDDVGVSGNALKAAKKAVVAEIDAYDQSEAVNGFTLNGSLVWLDKSTRVGLMNSTNIAKATGSANTTLWLGGERMVVPCDKAIQLLSALEMYALGCFNVTASHKAAVEAMTTIDEVLSYDYTKGYPERLKMEV